MNWCVITPYGQEWHPYVVADGDVILYPGGADTDMGDMTIQELVDVFGAVTVMEKSKD